MDSKILHRLSAVSPEEQAILDGRTTIDRGLYMQGQGNTINSRKLLDSGKLITVRPHTRFIHFPEHTHDYVEAVYMCSGETTHIVNGRTILLRTGELLFLSQSATHEVCRAGKEDVAVNFIVLPQFFDTALDAIGEEETPIRRFLVACLCGRSSDAGYLHFQVAEVKPVQNLVENLLWILLCDTPNKRKMSQMTMALLFLLLVGNTDTLAEEDQNDAAVFQVLRYVESNYREGSLSEAAERMHFDPCWLSRETRRKTGKTFTQLMQEKRLAQAAFLLRNTHRKVDDISAAVGYENVSYFHRLFSSAYGCSPKQFRDSGRAARKDTF